MIRVISAAALWSSLADHEKRGRACVCTLGLSLRHADSDTFLWVLFFLVIVMSFLSQTKNFLQLFVHVF